MRRPGHRRPRPGVITGPAPDLGLPARANLSFGDKVAVPAAKAKGNWGPDCLQIELFWVGPVMPRPNGPLQARPGAGAPAGHWEFYS